MRCGAAPDRERGTTRLIYSSVVFDERRIVLETLTGFKRAGIDMILTYHALDVARWLKQG